MSIPTNNVILSPIWNGMQFFDNNGAPLAGGLINTYAAGSFTSQLATYTDSTGSVANSNPIVLDSTGRVTTEIWLIDGASYNFVLTASNGSTVIMSCDNVYGIQPTAGSSGVTQLIAGSDIILTPSTGVGVVTVSSSGGSGGWSAPYITQLTGNGSSNFTGSYFNSWFANDQLPNSAIAQWDSSTSQLQFNAPGSYQVIVMVTAYATAGYWPNQATTYGTFINGALEYANRTCYSRTATGLSYTQNWLFFSGVSSATSWSDTFTVLVNTAGYEIPIGVFTETYDGFEYGVNFDVLLTVTQMSGTA